MKRNLEKMLNEFIERDFSLDEMLEVIASLHDIVEESRVCDIYCRREMWADAARLCVKVDHYRKNALAILKDYSLDYEIDDLI